MNYNNLQPCEAIKIPVFETNANDLAERVFNEYDDADQVAFINVLKGRIFALRNERANSLLEQSKAISERADYILKSNQTL